MSTSITSACMLAGRMTSAPRASPVTSVTTAKAATSPDPSHGATENAAQASIMPQHQARCLLVRRASQSQPGTPATPATK